MEGADQSGSRGLVVSWSLLVLVLVPSPYSEPVESSVTLDSTQLNLLHSAKMIVSKLSLSHYQSMVSVKSMTCCFVSQWYICEERKESEDER